MDVHNSPGTSPSLLYLKRKSHCFLFQLLVLTEMSDYIPRRGDHISIRSIRGIIRHHMLVTEIKNIHDSVLELKVIHITKKFFLDCRIAEDEMKVKKDTFIVHDYNSRYSVEEAIERARTKMKWNDDCDRYHLLMFNCEHFIRWAKTGVTNCHQLKQVGVGAASGVGGAASGAAAGNNRLMIVAIIVKI